MSFLLSSFSVFRFLLVGSVLTYVRFWAHFKIASRIASYLNCAIAHEELISQSRPWARRWINQWSLWRMASATPNLRLPSQPQGITAPWPVPNYSAWWPRQMCVNNFPKVVTWTLPHRTRQNGPVCVVSGVSWTIALNVFRLRIIFCRRQSWVVCGNPVYTAEVDATQTEQSCLVWRAGVNLAFRLATFYRVKLAPDCHWRLMLKLLLHLKLPLSLAAYYNQPDTENAESADYYRV